MKLSSTNFKHSLEITHTFLIHDTNHWLLLFEKFHELESSTLNWTTPMREVIVKSKKVKCLLQLRR